MIYATLDESGKVIEERSYNPPLSPKEITHHKNGNPHIAPLFLEEVSHDPDLQRLTGFSYQFDGEKVTKRPLFVSLTNEERQERTAQLKKETRKASLPDYDDGIEVLARVLLAVAERYAMTVDAADPRTTFNVNAEDIAKLKAIVSICEDCK